MLIQLGIVLIAHLLVLTESMFATIILSKQLYIPGKKWSVLNISQNIESLAREYYVNISLQLTQLAAGEQGNSVFDCFVLPLNTADYSESVACYTEAV